jgi:carbon-monoxide dehydrogenase medium subunit
MIPASFDYVRAKSVLDALKTLASNDGAKVLAGGHSLIPLLRLRLAQPGTLVDIGGLDDLRGLTAKGRGLRLGALSTYRDLLDSPLVRERYPLLIEATETIGDLPVRNAGTIGGALAHADPASDLPAVMLALDATFQLRSRSGRRAVPAREFFQGPFTTALGPGELLVEIVLPPPPRNAGMAYVSFEQQASGYAIVGVAAVVARSRKTVNHCAVGVTGAGDRPYLAQSAAKLIGTTAEGDAIAAVAGAVVEGVEVTSDIHAPADFRAHLARVATRRSLQTALRRSG